MAIRPPIPVRKKAGRPAQYTKPHRRTFMLSALALENLAQLAPRKPGRSMSDVVEAAVREYFNRYARQHDGHRR